jgi:hypothetical protein
MTYQPLVLQQVLVNGEIKVAMEDMLVKQRVERNPPLPAMV